MEEIENIARTTNLTRIASVAKIGQQIWVAVLTKNVLRKLLAEMYRRNGKYIKNNKLNKNCKLHQNS